MSPPIPILLYHGIAEDDDGPCAPWVLTPDAFEAHLGVIVDLGLRPVTVGEMVQRVHIERRSPEPGTVVITFDDGFADFATGAWPMLTAHHFAATLYVTSGGVGRTAHWMPGDGRHRPMLDWDDLRLLGAQGLEIGGHTLTHPEMDRMSTSAARAELRADREALEERLGQAVTTFAYPHGYHSARLTRLVAEEGYTSACAVGHALSSADDDRFALARLMVRRGDGPDVLRRWLRGEGVTTRPRGRRRGRAVAWRQLRRVRGVGSTRDQTRETPLPC